MMKKFLLAFPALIVSTPAAAQVWNHPDWTDGSVPAADWQTKARLVSEGQIIGDGTVNGGTPPATAYSPADIGPEALGYTTSNFTFATGGYLALTDSPSVEGKIRIGCDVVKTGQFDPVLFFGLDLTGHDHTFFGPSSAGPSSTYTTNRSTPGISTCVGGPLNMTAYWEPSMQIMLPSGYKATLRPWQTIFYYAINGALGKTLTHLPNGFAFIGGVNPADPNDTVRKAEYQAANLIYPGDGWVGYECFTLGADGVPETGDDVKINADTDAIGQVEPITGSNTGYSKALEKADGSDPWGGRCTAGYLIATVKAQQCWDGHNLTSPNGRDHLRYETRTGDSTFTSVCPKSWWRVPHFSVKIYFRHGGWTDYQRWFLSSDRYGFTEANWRKRGSTFHFDWKNGWDPAILKKWEKNCLGMTIDGVAGTIADCGFALIENGLAMNYGVPGQPGFSNNPIINGGADNYAPNDNRRFMSVQPGQKGPFSGHGSHGGGE
jgi:hypothetical protein